MQEKELFIDKTKELYSYYENQISRIFLENNYLKAVELTNNFFADFIENFSEIIKEDLFFDLRKISLNINLMLLKMYINFRSILRIESSKSETLNEFYKELLLALETNKVVKAFIVSFSTELYHPTTNYLRSNLLNNVLKKLYYFMKVFDRKFEFLIVNSLPEEMRSKALSLTERHIDSWKNIFKRKSFNNNLKGIEVLFATYIIDYDLESIEDINLFNINGFRFILESYYSFLNKFIFHLNQNMINLLNYGVESFFSMNSNLMSLCIRYGFIDLITIDIEKYGFFKRAKSELKSLMNQLIENIIKLKNLNNLRLDANDIINSLFIDLINNAFLSKSVEFIIKVKQLHIKNQDIMKKQALEGYNNLFSVEDLPEEVFKVEFIEKPITIGFGFAFVDLLKEFDSYIPNLYSESKNINKNENINNINENENIYESEKHPDLEKIRLYLMDFQEKNQTIIADLNKGKFIENNYPGRFVGYSNENDANFKKMTSKFVELIVV